MLKKLELLAFIELVVIAFLVIFIIHDRNEILTNSNPANANASKFNLLSPRISSGILEPKSLLIVNYAPLRYKLESYILKNNLNISVYVENLRSGASIGINERQGFPPASINKVPLAMLIMKEIEDGKLSLDTMLIINESDRTNTSGTLYKAKGTKLPVRILIERMLQESDNTAFNTLQHYIDQNDMALLLTYLDYYSEETIDFARQDSDDGTITTKSIYNLFSSLYLSTFLSPEHSQYVISLLTDTIFDIKKVANLPDDVTVAQKFGSKYIEKDKYFHSCGIIYDDKIRLFYCIMTKDIKSDKAIATIGWIVNNIYGYTLDTRKKLDTYKEPKGNY